MKNNFRQYKFQLIRYTPDLIRNESINIGVIVQEVDSDTPTKIRLTRNWQRVRNLHPDVDTNSLYAFEDELRKHLNTDGKGNDAIFFDEILPVNIQITHPKAFLIGDIESGMEELMHSYVETPAPKSIAKSHSRADIRAKMRSAFKQTGIWNHLRKRIAVADYTHPDDPFRVDYGYRKNDLIRMFHAVNLARNSEMAKALAFVSSTLHEGIQTAESINLILTAVVKPIDEFQAGDTTDVRLRHYNFGIEIMRENQIEVRTTLDLKHIADTAKNELIIQ